MLEREIRRKFLKTDFKELHKIKTDQQKGATPPDLEKPFEDSLKQIDLPEITDSDYSNTGLSEAISRRRSQRKFTKEPFTLKELSYLLWATQGVREVFKRDGKAIASFRNVPSAGARHPFETYLIIFNVETLEPGIYRYLPFEHKLIFLHEDPELDKKAVEAVLGQAFAKSSAAVFVWSSIPYRTEWRYDMASCKLILLDAGHICQNLYLACESIKAGACAIAAYDQDKIDELLKLDGDNEMVIYLAPAGKIV